MRLSEPHSCPLSPVDLVSYLASSPSPALGTTLEVPVLQHRAFTHYQVSSAEWSVRSKLQWENSPGRREGHVNMKCNALHMVGPVDVKVNVNSRAQMLALSRLVSRRFSVLDDGSMLVDLLIPPQPALLPREGRGEGNVGRVLPAAIEAVSLRRIQKRMAQGRAASPHRGEGSESEEGDGEEVKELICLLEARMRDWSCGVRLDLDALLLEMQVGMVGGWW